MRNARAHKLQWSGPTVHSSTVVMYKAITGNLLRLKGFTNMLMNYKCAGAFEHYI